MARLSRPGQALLGAALLAAGAYSWWASGTAPFNWSSTLAVAVPVILVGLASLTRPATGESRPQAEARPTSGWLPWLVLALLVVGLEAAGLALGGVSRPVPTLSTVVDQLLRWQVVRFLLFGSWLASATPLWRRPAGEAASR